MDIPRHLTGHIAFVLNLAGRMSPATGQANRMSLRIVRVDDAKGWNYALKRWEPLPLSSANYVRFPTYLEQTMYGDTYRVILADPTIRWERAHYLARMMHTKQGTVAEQEFTVGMFQDRRLGHSVVYDGSKLTLQLWVEEGGVFQDDYATLQDVKIVNRSGATVLNLGTMTANSSRAVARDKR